MRKYKLSSLFLALTLIIAGTFNNLSLSYAHNDSNTLDPSLHQKQNEGIKTSVNEYELLKQINEEYTKAKKNETLNSNSKFNSLSVEEVYMIENYKEAYSNKIYELKDWKTEELQAVGYNDKQVNAIKTFDGSEEKLVLAVFVSFL